MLYTIQASRSTFGAMHLGEQQLSMKSNGSKLNGRSTF